ncbi:hypothetical protein C8F01DRAFT_1145102 [Mycena amicta]|nr:hypothetical protein C8F01DRAFT_1145102 [Mycena amicta]
MLALPQLPTPDASAHTQRAVLAEIRSTLANARTQHVVRSEALKTARLEAEAALKRSTLFKLPPIHILSFPVEITSIIFIACLPAHGRVRPSIDSAPLLLMQICAQWRAIAQHLPQLWNSLDLELRAAWYSGMKITLRPGNSVSVFKAWTARGKGVPGVLTIRQPMFMERTLYFSPLPRYFKAFNVSSLRSLEADLSPEQFRQLVPLGTPLPHLESLAAAARTYHVEDILRNAPRLRNLRLRELSSKALINSPTLVQVDIEDGRPALTFSAFCQLVLCCPNLASLQCRVGTPDKDQGPMEVSNLKSLRLTSYPAYDAFLVLDRLTLPNLECLGLTMSGPAGRDILRSFHMRSGSGCSISTLHLVHPSPRTPSESLQQQDGREFDGDREWLTMECFSSVKVLHLRVDQYKEEVFPPRNTLYADPSLLPNLQHFTLSVSFSKCLSIVYSRIASILFRFGRSRPLSSFHLDVDASEENCPASAWKPPLVYTSVLSGRFSVEARADDEYSGGVVVYRWPEDPKDPCERFDLRSDVWGDPMRLAFNSASYDVDDSSSDEFL